MPNTAFPASDQIESPQSAVSWAAIIAGATAATVLSLLLLVVGAGIGLVSISPWSNSGASGTTVGILAVLWSIAVPLFAYAVGGYLAGRLRTQWVDVHSDEAFFRDTAHGLLVWAVGTIITACLIGSLLASAVSGVAQTGAALTKAAATTVGSATANSDVTAYFNDMLFRSEQAPAQAGNDTAAKAEVGRIIARSVAAGQLGDDDKNYVAQVISRQAGISQAEAAKRIEDVQAKTKEATQQAADKAKAAAEVARKAAVYAALWAFVALLVGAFSASFMAAMGGRSRDEPSAT